MATPLVPQQNLDNVKASVWCVLRNDQGKFLLLKRSKSANNGGQWNFPGGNIDPGETPKTAGKREFWEECGVNIVSWTPFLRINSKSRIMHFIKPSVPVTLKKVHINGESSKYDWVSAKELNKLNLHEPTRAYFNHLTNKDLLQFKKKLVKSNLFLDIQATINDNVVGQATVCIPTRKLHNVEVQSDYRGFGYADSLMQYIMALENHPTQLTANAARNNSSVVTSSDNSVESSGLSTKQLVTFYGKYGFAPVDKASVKSGLPVPMVLSGHFAFAGK